VAAAGVKRAGAIMLLVLLMVSFVGLTGDEVVRADGVGGGHPTPPPTDSTQNADSSDTGGTDPNLYLNLKL
jgi:hypothetical protein